MSDAPLIDGAIKATKNSLSKGSEKKKQKLLGYLEMRSKVSSRNKAGSQKTRVMICDVSEAAEQTLGGLRKELADAARYLQLEPPLLDQFKATFEVRVTTGAAIWEAIDNNRFWEEAQLEAIEYARDQLAPRHLEQIRNQGIQLRKELVRWANVVGAVQGELPAEVAEQLDAQTTAFVASLEKEKDRMIRTIQNGAAAYLVDFMKQQLKLEKQVIQYKAGKSGIVIVNLGLIAGHIAHMAASFGATSGLAIVAIVRLSIEIGQITEKALNDLEGIGERIETFLKIVEKGWLDRKDGAVSGKERATTLEALAGVVQGLTKIEVPSLETVKSLINDYQHKLNILSKSYNDLGAVLAKLQNVLVAYTGILNTYTKQMSDEQRRKLNDLINESEHTYNILLKKGLGSGGKKQRIEQAKKNTEDWNKRLKAIEEKTNAWVKYVVMVTNLATSAGLSLGAATGEMLEVINHAHELAAELAEAVHEHAVDVVEHLMEELPDALAEAADAPIQVLGEALLTLGADGVMATVLDKLAEVRG